MVECPSQGFNPAIGDTNGTTFNPYGPTTNISGVPGFGPAPFDQSVVDGPDAFKMFTKATQYHIEDEFENRTNHECIDYMEDITPVLFDQLKKVVDAYTLRTLDGAIQAVNVELPKMA